MKPLFKRFIDQLHFQCYLQVNELIFLSLGGHLSVVTRIILHTRQPLYLV